MNAEVLSDREKQVIENPRNKVLCSSISFFEISLKYSLGKLSLTGLSPEQMPELMLANGYEISDISYKTFATYHQLNKEYHKDPFDRLIIWQAMQSHFHLLTRDAEMKKYKSQGLQLWDSD